MVPQADEGRKSRKHSRLSCLRRRRRRRCRRRRRHHPPKAGDDSDLSEGFESDSSHNSAQASEGSDSGSDKSLEGRGTAFDAETDSEMNSQESRSDLEDMEDEEGTRLPALEAPQARSEAPDSLNGPLGPSEASIASNLQAMSTQMFQTKRCFRLAPTFSNLLLQPTTEPNNVASHRACVNGDVDKPLEPGMWSLCPACVHERLHSLRVTSPLMLHCHPGVLFLCTYSFPDSKTFVVLLLCTTDCPVASGSSLLTLAVVEPSLMVSNFPQGVQLPPGLPEAEHILLSEQYI